MRKAILLAALLGTIACACDAREDGRDAEVGNVLARFDEPHIRTRPSLVAGKYTRMALSPFDYLRGSLPVYRNDARAGTTLTSVSRFGMDLPLVPSLGDPHPENFGALRAGDGSLGIEPNGFDASDRAPYLWDVRAVVSSPGRCPAARTTKGLFDARAPSLLSVLSPLDLRRPAAET